MPDRKKVEQIMAHKGMTQLDLCSASGLTQSHLSHILTRNSDLRESTLKKLCRGLGCKAEDIW